MIKVNFTTAETVGQKEVRSFSVERNNKKERKTSGKESKNTRAKRATWQRRSSLLNSPAVSTDCSDTVVISLKQRTVNVDVH